MTKGQSYKKPSSLLRKNNFASRIKSSCNKAIHIFTCLHSGPEPSPAETSLSSSGTSSSLPASKAFCNVSSLCDPTVQHLCSPTAPVIIICSLETKTEKGMGNVDDTSCLQASWGATAPCSSHCRHMCGIGKQVTSTSPHQEGGNLSIIKDFDGENVKGTVSSAKSGGYSKVLPVLPIEVTSLGLLKS